MLILTILRFKQSIFREASSFKDKESGKEITVGATYIADVDYADSQYSKIAKSKIKKMSSKEVNCDFEPPQSGEWLCEVEAKGKDGDFKVIRVIAQADLNTLLVKPAAATPPTKKESKNESKTEAGRA
ncbi:MAG TPA: hypothetical protein VFO10_02540 [Oligoflexus sp.]|uniref:hypothetical protein n=1 Tax=Oligoflexus sp. TaxID=1971216 RepID=UPI002D7E46D7|nr:hypothetical protein [Oligoflexus sp.]HET9236099.1 hypothetical protein [Oligoflexus sp.]